MGESFHSMGRMTGAAGFKRDSVASRGGAPDPGLTGFSYHDPNTPMLNPNKIGASALGVDKPTEDHSGNSAMKKSFTQRMGAGAGEAAGGDNRPPKYVPSRRDPANARVGLRDSLNGSEMASKNDSAGGSNYQPKTSFSYVPSAEIA